MRFARLLLSGRVVCGGLFCCRCWQQSSPFVESALSASLARGVLYGLPSCFLEGLPFSLARGVHALFTGSCFRYSDLPLRKQKFRSFCNYFAIADPRLLLEDGNEPPSKGSAAFLRRYWHSIVPQQSAIAKKLQSGSIFCFWSPRDGFLAVLWAG